MTPLVVTLVGVPEAPESTPTGLVVFLDHVQTVRKTAEAMGLETVPEAEGMAETVGTRGYQILAEVVGVEDRKGVVAERVMRAVTWLRIADRESQEAIYRIISSLALTTPHAIR